MLDDILKERLKKLDLYRETTDPYPARTRRTTVIDAFNRGFWRYRLARRRIFITGRIVGLRDQGKIIFADIADASGQVQVILSREKLASYQLFKGTLDIGDFLEVAGRAFRTQKGEKSLLAEQARLLVKSLRPMPSHWYGLEDAEIRLRQRYLDLLIHPELRDLFRKKSLFWNIIRDHLQSAGYLEVETPVLESIPGGAEAEPFLTHHNALNTDFYLRISLELPLKKLLVGGYEKVFEIGRVFRNEGIDKEHLQDYTQMECYAAYEDYRQLMNFVETMYKKIIKKVCGNLTTVYEDQSIDWSKTWPQLEYFDLFEKYAGLKLSEAADEDLRRKAKSLQLAFEPNWGRGRLIDLIYKKTVRPHLQQPCFLINPPVEIEPLAKKMAERPERVERFQVMAGGTELGKGFSELNDPLDQRRRFEEQMKLRAEGDPEAQRLDADFLEALEYGLPPAAGFGMSERLFAVLMDRPVREMVFFPLMKRKN